MTALQESAEKFAQDLISNNIAGLMTVFTPEGMNKAMMMQAQMQANEPQKPATGYEVRPGEPQGEDVLVDVVLKNEDGELVIETWWREVEGMWKVNDLHLKNA